MLTAWVYKNLIGDMTICYYIVNPKLAHVSVFLRDCRHYQKIYISVLGDSIRILFGKVFLLELKDCDIRCYAIPR